MRGEQWVDGQSLYLLRNIAVNLQLLQKKKKNRSLLKEKPCRYCDDKNANSFTLYRIKSSFWYQLGQYADNTSRRKTMKTSRGKGFSSYLANR